MSAYDPQKEELYHIAGDTEEGRGAYSDIRLTKTAIGRPMVRYKDRILECDVYLIGGELMVHLICPRCCNALRVSAKNKRIDFSDGKLTVEPFQCTWELGERDGERMDFGVGLCRWKAAIDENRAKDA